MDRSDRQEDAMSKFMMIFRGSEYPRMSAEEAQKHTQKFLTWFEGLTRDGAYHGEGAPLDRSGKVVRGARGVVSDGPFVEAKDVVGGYAIVEARDLAAAAELTRGCPIFEANGLVEVRPVRQVS
jgi:hypothetical protein